MVEDLLRDKGLGGEGAEGEDVAGVGGGWVWGVARGSSKVTAQFGCKPKTRRKDAICIHELIRKVVHKRVYNVPSVSPHRQDIKMSSLFALKENALRL